MARRSVAAALEQFHRSFGVMRARPNNTPGRNMSDTCVEGAGQLVTAVIRLIIRLESWLLSATGEVFDLGYWKCKLTQGVEQFDTDGIEIRFKITRPLLFCSLRRNNVRVSSGGYISNLCDDYSFVGQLESTIGVRQGEEEMIRTMPVKAKAGPTAIPAFRDAPEMETITRCDI